MTTETVEQATELVDRAEINSGTVLVEYSRTEAALAELRAKYSGAKFDLTTTAGDKAARAARLELVTLRTSLEKKRKELKAPAVEFGKKIDDEAKRITSEITSLEDPIDAQIKADERRREAERLERERIEAERVAAIKTKIDTIRSCATRANTPDMTSERIQLGIDKVEAIDIDKQVFAEFTEEAAQAKSSTLAVMLNLRDTAKAREDEAARVEAQRLENERIAAKQRAAAEALAAQQKALAEQAEALAAQQKALDDAKAEEAARLERQRAEEAAALERAEAERIAAAQQNSEAQAPQQVLKAEAEMPDATDRGEPVTTNPSVGSMGAGQAADAAPVDPLQDEAEKLVIEHGRASIGLVQRHLRIGYNHAARLLEAMETKGLIAPMATDGSRRVVGYQNVGECVVAAAPTALKAVHPAAAALRNDPPTLKLGTICERLGFTVSAAFLAELGFEASMDKRACLYRESEWQAICQGISAHVLAAGVKRLEAA